MAQLDRSLLEYVAEMFFVSFLLISFLTIIGCAYIYAELAVRARLLVGVCRPFLLLSAMVKNHLVTYPTPVNFGYINSFGAIAGVLLGFQICTGLLLARFYTPHVDFAFLSVEHIRRDVTGGWLLRYCHSNGASFFFIVVYIHRLRGLYYKSFLPTRLTVWVSGVVIFVLMIATAFLGYVLPWGQRSFWGATVITNLFSAVPFVGSSIVEWLWGGFSVSNATLNRFFVLHFILPFLLAVVVFVHLWKLHAVGSSNRLGAEGLARVDRLQFYPYFYVKDVFVGVLVGMCFVYVIFFRPNVLGHPDNYIPANPIVTPAHIVPEWYFLLFYAILRVVPQKLGGVRLMFGAIFMLLVLGFLAVAAGSVSGMLASRFTAGQKISVVAFWRILVPIFILTWLGRQPVEEPFLTVGVWRVVLYFTLFGVVYLVVWVIENFILYSFINNIGAGDAGGNTSLRLFFKANTALFELERGVWGGGDEEEEWSLCAVSGTQQAVRRERVVFFRSGGSGGFEEVLGSLEEDSVRGGAVITGSMTSAVFLKYHSLTKLQVLRYRTAVDEPGKVARFTISLFLVNFRGVQYRLFLQVPEGGRYRSFVNVFSNAEVFEREVWDRFGVVAADAGDLRRLLSNYGFKGHALRKDFPLTGFMEVGYNDARKVIVEGPVELRQQYRVFYFDEQQWAYSTTNISEDVSDQVRNDDRNGELVEFLWEEAFLYLETNKILEKNVTDVVRAD